MNDHWDAAWHTSNSSPGDDKGRGGVAKVSAARPCKAHAPSDGRTCRSTRAHLHVQGKEASPGAGGLSIGGEGGRLHTARVVHPYPIGGVLVHVNMNAGHSAWDWVTAAGRSPGSDPVPCGPQRVTEHTLSRLRRPRATLHAPVWDSNSRSRASHALSVLLEVVVRGGGGGGGIKAERVCRLVLPGVQTSFPVEEGIVHWWMGGSGAHPLGRG